MTPWERFKEKIYESVWWKLTRMGWDNRQLRKENKKLKEELARLTLVLEEYTNE